MTVAHGLSQRPRADSRRRVEDDAQRAGTRDGLNTLATEFTTVLDGAVGTWLFGPAILVRRTGNRLGVLALERLPELALCVIPGRLCVIPGRL